MHSKARGNKGGCPFSRGILYKILSNPIYIGKIRHKGTSYPGQHQAIIDQELWEQVQKHMAKNSMEHRTRSFRTVSCPLANKLFDVSGERLVPVHVNKKGRRYRYYISESLRSDPKGASQTGWRLPGQEIENVIAQETLMILRDDAAIAATLNESGIATRQISSALATVKEVQSKTSALIDRFIQRVELRQDGLRLTMSLGSIVASEGVDHALTISRDIPMQMKRRGIEMRLVIGGERPGRVDQSLLKTIIRAHKWFNDLVAGRAKNMTEIALQEGVDRSYVSRVMNLAFLSPDITESIIAGQQPADLNIEKLTKRIDLPLCWTRQCQLLGFQ
jgi:hypothetical protein